ncbi:MAG: hypothetical protein IJ208_07010 [Butyrivibrio sp.]|nr:hypothetical protein [Butyrivibrio sp.]
MNDNGNNVNNKLGVRPALPGCQKCMEGFMRQCVVAKEPGSFSAEVSAGKTHAVGDFGRRQLSKHWEWGDPFPRQPLEENE